MGKLRDVWKKGKNQVKAEFVGGFGTMDIKFGSQLDVVEDCLRALKGSLIEAVDSAELLIPKWSDFNQALEKTRKALAECAEEDPKLFKPMVDAYNSILLELSHLLRDVHNLFDKIHKAKDGLKPPQK